MHFAFLKIRPYNGLMAKFFGLDVPEGLAPLYFYIVNVVEGNASLNYKNRPSGKVAEKRKRLAGVSLFTFWESLWDGFDGSRKSAWTTYWGTLPFGSHSGAGGWPGSGYSAFVYVNAPRYRNGEDLLLDPPAGLGPELLLNPDFDGNADHWYFDYGDNQFVYDDHSIKLSTFDLIDAYVRQEIMPLVAPATFRLQLDMSVQRVGDDDNLYYNFNVDSSAGGEGYPQFSDGIWPDLDGVLRHYSWDGFLDGEGPDEGSTLTLDFFSDEIDAWEIVITNVSLKKVL